MLHGKQELPAFRLGARGMPVGGWVCSGSVGGCTEGGWVGVQWVGGRVGGWVYY
jgi:hypothetical protein